MRTNIEEYYQMKKRAGAIVTNKCKECRNLVSELYQRGVPSNEDYVSDERIDKSIEYAETLIKELEELRQLHNQRLLLDCVEVTVSDGALGVSDVVDVEEEKAEIEW
jgi:hypothetical protein